MNYTDRTTKDIVQAIRIDSDIKSVGVRMYGLGKFNCLEMYDMDMSENECQSLGIHPDNEIARFIMLVRGYDKKLAETRTDAK